MSIEYTINFTEDYKNAILNHFKQNDIDLTPFNTQDIFKLSLEFHKYQKALLEEGTAPDNTSMDAKYSSDMMFKWLNHLEEQIEESIEDIVKLALEHNISITKYPLHIQLQLDIQTRSFEIFETQNQFHINLEL